MPKPHKSDTRGGGGSFTAELATIWADLALTGSTRAWPRQQSFGTLRHGENHQRLSSGDSI